MKTQDLEDEKTFYEYCGEYHVEEQQVENDSPFGKCEQCGKDLDLMAAFTQYQVCGKCCKANHKKALRG